MGAWRICFLSDIIQNIFATTITDFLRKPKLVLKRVSSEDVVLRRRGKNVVRLVAESRASNNSESADLTGYLLSQLIDGAGEGPAMTQRLAGLLQKRFAWVKFLPESARGEFTHEFVETLRACVSVGKSSRLDEVVCSWKSTAEIYADPQLAAELKRPLSSSEGRRIARP